jgi:hypothetical protein
MTKYIIAEVESVGVSYVIEESTVSSDFAKKYDLPEGCSIKVMQGLDVIESYASIQEAYEAHNKPTITKYLKKISVDANVFKTLLKTKVLTVLIYPTKRRS